MEYTPGIELPKVSFSSINYIEIPVGEVSCKSTGEAVEKGGDKIVLIVPW